MVAKLSRLTHKIAIQLHLVAESCTICSYRSRRPIRKLLDTPSCVCVCVCVWSGQQSSNEQYAEDGNHNEETERGSAPVPPNVRTTNDTGSKSSLGIQWNKEEVQEVVWCFVYVKATSLRENCRAAYEMWRKTSQSLRKYRQEKN
jgi:hypothetical protein